MAKNKNCAGTYKVSGYTRDDGTKVDSYWRTCGAKHEGDNSPSQRHQSKSTGMIGGAAPVEESKNSFLDAAQDMFIIDAEILSYFFLSKTYYFSFSFGQEMLAQLPTFNKIYHDYYKLSLDYYNKKQHNKENVYIKFNDIQDNNIKSFIKQQYSDADINDATDIVIPQQDSRLVKMVYNSPELKDVIRKNLPGIINGKYKNNFFSIVFDKTKDIHLTIGKAKLYNVRIVDGYICGTLVDYYDFEYLVYKWGKNKDSLFNILVNNNAYKQQILKKLTNYLLVFPVRIPLKNI